MAKTLFSRGRVVTSAFLNAVFSHVHDGTGADDSTNTDGHASKINLTNAAEVTGILPLANMSPILSSPGYIDGFRMRYALSFGADNLVVYSGYAHNSGNNKMLQLVEAGAGFYKSILNSARTQKVAWTQGNYGGAWPTAVDLAEGWFHVFVIGKTSDASAAEIGIDSSLTAANLMSVAAGNPGVSGFNIYRRIGSLLIDQKGGSGLDAWRVVPFRSHGDRFLWYSCFVDYNTVPAGTAWTARQLTVPGGLSVRAIFALYSRTDNVSGQWTHNLRDGAIPDDPANTGIKLYGGSNQAISTTLDLVTDSNRGIMEYASVASQVYFTIHTIGWIDPRGRLS